MQASKNVALYVVVFSVFVGSVWGTAAFPAKMGIDIGTPEYADGLYVEVEAARAMYFGNETLTVTIAGGNSGQTVDVDLYAAIEVPYGPLLYLPGLTTEPRSWFGKFSLPSGFVQAPFEAFSYTFSGLEPNGTYSIYYALVISDPDGSESYSGTSEFRYRRTLGTELQVNQDGSGDFLTIQEAIDSALEGETVVVHPSTYYENIQFPGCNIVLRSLDPEDPEVVESTVIDGGRNDSVIRFSGFENDSCFLCGFTIRNGKAHAGGGIYGEGTHANITNCTFTDNEATWRGGAICACCGLIANCLITSNTASEGGGVSWCSGAIFNCLIIDNTARYEGGGVHLCNSVITNCTVSGNSAVIYHGGGLAKCWTGIWNCIIWGNYSSFGADLDENCTSPSYSLIGAWFEFEGDTNIVGRSPRFVAGPFGYYYLNSRRTPTMPRSPCIDAGYGTAEEAGLADRTTRTDQAPDTGTVDMGYHYAVADVATDAHISRSVE